jgi:hypothetical protein
VLWAIEQQRKPDQRPASQIEENQGLLHGTGVWAKGCRMGVIALTNYDELHKLTI